MVMSAVPSPLASTSTWLPDTRASELFDPPVKAPVPVADPAAEERERRKSAALNRAAVELASARETASQDTGKMIHIGIAVVLFLLGIARACSHLDHH